MCTWNGRMFLLVSFLAFSSWGFSESQIAEPIDRRCCIVGGVRRVSVLRCLDYVIAPHFWTLFGVRDDVMTIPAARASRRSQQNKLDRQCKKKSKRKIDPLQFTATSIENPKCPLAQDPTAPSIRRETSQSWAPSDRSLFLNGHHRSILRRSIPSIATVKGRPASCPHSGDSQLLPATAAVERPSISVDCHS